MEIHGALDLGIAACSYGLGFRGFRKDSTSVFYRHAVFYVAAGHVYLSAFSVIDRTAVLGGTVFQRASGKGCHTDLFRHNHGTCIIQASSAAGDLALDQLTAGEGKTGIGRHIDTSAIYCVGACTGSLNLVGLIICSQRECRMSVNDHAVFFCSDSARCINRTTVGRRLTIIETGISDIKVSSRGIYAAAVDSLAVSHYRIVTHRQTTGRPHDDAAVSGTCLCGCLSIASVKDDVGRCKGAAVGEHAAPGHRTGDSCISGVIIIVFSAVGRSESDIAADGDGYILRCIVVDQHFNGVRLVDDLTQLPSADIAVVVDEVHRLLDRIKHMLLSVLIDDLADSPHGVEGIGILRIDSIDIRRVSISGYRKRSCGKICPACQSNHVAVAV